MIFFVLNAAKLLEFGSGLDTGESCLVDAIDLVVGGGAESIISNR
jgi:hypothetical protein